MTLPEAITTLLNANAALLSSVPTENIVPVDALQNTSNPVIAYELVNTLPEDDKDGSVIEETQLEIDIYTDGYLQGHEILNLVRTALNRKSGDYTDFKIDNIVFEGYQDRGLNIETSTFRISSGFLVRVKYD